ncbi:MAG: hypothetical protein HOC74_14225 [Gemmatimonadetes bacterium]|jgi:solute:Na+ symporter, SSS family|nr:hypothetical protein [Gemmatimonadota bacterium]
MTIRIILLIATCLISTAQAGNWPIQTTIYRGTTPTLDGVIAPGEYDDATRIDGVDGWNSQFTPVADPADLGIVVWAKHDGENLYFAFDITDDILYAIDIDRWLPDNNAQAHELTRKGWPWFGDGVELLVNAAYKWSDEDRQNNAGDGSSWQMVCSTHKSRLGGLGVGGLMEGEQRSMKSAWDNYQKWIRDGSMQAAVRLKDAKKEGKGFVIEWLVKPDPCLEVAPGKFWNPEMGPVKMGLNIAASDIDEKERGADNFGNFHHEDWWAGEKDKRTWLKQWGTMVVMPHGRGTPR